MSTAHSPTELSLCRDLVAVGHPQVRHPVQRRAPHQQLRRLPVKAPRPDSLAKDHLHPEDCRLGQRAPMVVTFALPLRPPRAADAAQVLIAEVAFGFRVAVLPDARPLLRRDRRPRFPPSNRVVTVAAIIRPIGGDLLDLVLDLLKQVWQDLRVFETIGRDHSGHDLPRRLIHTEVEFAPRAAATPPVLPHLPLTLAINFDARRVHHQMQRARLVPARQGDVERAATAAQGRVTGHAQLDIEQSDDRAQQPAGGPQRQGVNFRERRHAEDGDVGVEGRLPASARARRVLPRRQDLCTDPEGQASAPDQSFVILAPVTETVRAFGFLAFHTSRLPALPSP